MTDHLSYTLSEDSEYLSVQLPEGENTYQDFKHTISDYHKIARSLVAFANKNSGSLLIGVDDKGGVIGCEARSEYYRLVDVLEHYCQPRPEVECIVHEEEGKEVLEIRVREGAFKPYASKHKSGKWHIYLRVEDRCVKIGSL